MTIALIIIIIAFVLFLIYHFWKSHQDKTTTNTKIKDLENRLTNLWSEKITLQDELDSVNDELKSYEQEELLTGSIASAAKKVEEYNQQVENYTKQIHEKTTILNDLNNKINQATSDLQKSAVDEQNLALSTSKLDKINANFKSNLMTWINTYNAMFERYKEDYVASGWSIELDPYQAFELDELRPVLKKLKNPAPLAKAIWEMYYRDEMKDMINRAGLNKRVTGIYRIWDKDDEKLCYVGKSVDIGERWMQHGKRLVGAEPITGIKLYSSGLILENLKWEVLETCGEDVLGEKEKYWIEYYDARKGLNSK